ncbi:uncharacterized protein TrAtP1_005514 [Trichoderma atroviride]|uniref:Uncharacterized protein n=1 Tax=Hypocrea atroviridis (strain ATCC 20476 / IMI 206040) TaxID=452589 RepID=G9NSY5_HYPAI|nr:uncharacterized protein TRIATDRAFT_317507 [Trichoderma atroviride IMI 206040]EHK46529.1 hypothetical protein TRIATDRAFT_317507 [Trichoderma atroviride IMI 206040]UKZ64296.1 hypothetical protein TrAtP1_005514 [Trichoderma atroviride]
MASNAAYNNNNTSNTASPATTSAATSAATTGCTQAAVALVPADATFIVRRFVSDPDQHPPLGLKRSPSEAEAESKMLAQLRAFDEKFGSPSAGS